MYYILNDNISLRSWWGVPNAYYYKNSSLASGLSEEEFELMMKCDGNTDIEENELIKDLLKRKLIKECEVGSKLSSWQKYKNHDNRYMPMMNLQITGRCNYNCKHCFNAKDNSPLQTELSFDEIKKILDSCEETGITSFTITGGEPMAHHDYKKIIEEIYKRDMFVFELNTNGFYINQEILDWMKSINYNPLIKISFDSLNHHDWMRGFEGAEAKTLDAIKLCIKNDFKVFIQMNVNKNNLDTINKSLDLLDSLGVKETRLIKTTDAPRWLQNGKDYSLSVNEYYDACIDIVKEFLTKERTMTLTSWLLFSINTKEKYYNFIPVVCSKNNYRDTLPLCKGARGMIAVGSNGNVYPCMQSQGYFELHNIYLGNVLKDGLKKILQDSAYLDMVTLTVKEKYDYSKKCQECEYFKICVGGCPAVSILTSEHYMLEDKSKCIFFKQGYADKFEEVISKDYRNLSKVNMSE